MVAQLCKFLLEVVTTNFSSCLYANTPTSARHKELHEAWLTHENVKKTRLFRPHKHTSTHLTQKWSDMMASKNTDVWAKWVL